MKKRLLILCIFFTFNFICQSQVVSKIDTIKQYKYDTLVKESYNLDYERDTSMVNLFKPYFVNDICEPGCLNHPLFKSFMNKGEKLKGLAFDIFKNKVIEFKKSNPNVIDAITLMTKEINLSLLTLVQEPVYYLSPNVVLYTKGQNLKQFFILDTSCFTYRLMYGNRFIGLITYKDNQIDILSLSYDIGKLSFESVKSLRKEPLCLYEGILLFQKYRLRAYLSYGYLVNNRVVISKCETGDYIKSNDPSHEYHSEECAIKFIEDLYSKKGKTLFELIEEYGKFLTDRIKKE